MQTVLIVFQIFLGILIAVLILLQGKGGGLGRTFGTTAYHSRRGLETLMFRSTIILVVVFVALSVIGQLLV